MSEPGWAEVLADNRAEESPAARSVRLARQAAEREDRQAVFDEAERAAAIEDERDRRLMQAQQLGIGGRSLADLTADATRASDEDDEYVAAQKTIARIDQRRESRARVQRFLAEQVAMAARTQVPADPLEAASRRAHEAFRTATRAARNEAFSGRPTRPKAGVSRSHGGGAGEQECVHCINQGVDAETSFLLHSDPSRRVPVTTAEQAEQADPGQRSRRQSYGEAVR